MISATEMREFLAYLYNCTNGQVLGVYDKEREAGREEYAELALAEVERRGIFIGPEERFER